MNVRGTASFGWLSLVVFTSCTHDIYRSNYIPHHGEFSKCKVVFKKTVAPGDSLQKVGEVELKDSHYSTRCNEAHALQLLEKEACALNANVVKIVQEKRPNLGGSCYRCKAEIFKASLSSEELKSDDYYRKEEIKKRVKADKKTNTALLVTSIALGFVIAALIFFL